MNSSKMRDDKFSGIDVQTVYDELRRFALSLANRYANPDNPMMGADDIFGELMIELVKGVHHYHDKNLEQKKAIIRRMMDNRIAELRFRYYRTHRIAEKDILSLEMTAAGNDPNKIFNNTNTDSGTYLVEELVGSSEGDPDAMLTSKTKVQEIRSKLSPQALEILDSILNGNKQLNTVVIIALIRSAQVHKNPKVQIRPRHVADALLIPERDVRKAFREIKLVCAEVL